MKQAISICVAVWLLAGAGRADVVVQRWGLYKHVQHPGTLTETMAGQKKVLTFDLSALPGGAKVYRARFVPLTGEGYEITAPVQGKDTPLKLVGPYFLWLDATDAVRSAAGARKLELTLQRSYQFSGAKSYLEIAYEGRLKDKPAQAAELNILPRPGQVLLTWKEIWDIAEGNAEITWGEMVKKITRAGCTPLGLFPKDDEREIRYRIYTHTAPITAKNLGAATLIHEARSGSGYIEEGIARGKVGEQGPTYLKAKQALRRVVLEPGKVLPVGYGFHAHTVKFAGKAYYAVTAVVNGAENTVDVSAANAAGPVDQKVRVPEPMFYGANVKKLRSPKDAEHREEWYQWWLREQMTAYPRRYLLTVSYCPQAMAKAAPLTVTRGHAWRNTPEPPGPAARSGVVLAPTGDNPNAFWMGLPTFYHNLRGRFQSKWRPWPQMRNEWLIHWLKRKFQIDEERIVGSIGCWGMMEIERADIYSFLHGWGQPEVTKGFQCWGRSGVWGGPAAYAGRPKDENPYWRQDYARWARENPARETPFFIMHTGWGAHFTEMGWPPFPRFWRAMMDARRPFNYLWRVKHRPAIRRNQSVPAFGNCSLDGMPGNGNRGHGETFGAGINAHLTWDSETIVDEPGKWEMTVVLDDGAPLGECRVDLTPRKCQKFKAKKGQKFRWTCTTTALPAGKPAKKGDKPAPAAGGERLGGGTVTADQWGLVTIRRMRMLKGAQRVVIAGR